MKKIIYLIIAILPSIVVASHFRSMSADYEVGFGIFGTIGKAHCELLVDSGTYKIKVKVDSKGIAKLFSDREEIYESTGLIKDNLLVPTIFAKSRSWDDRSDSKKYFIDHKAKKVAVTRTVIKDGKSLAKHSTLPYYAKNDILTLFFNLDQITKDSNLTNWLRVSAIGAKRDNGEIDLKLPNRKEKELMRELLGVENRLMLVTLNKKIFSSQNGEFMIDIDKNHMCDRFILKDVILGGDLYGKLIDYKIEE